MSRRRSPLRITGALVALLIALCTLVPGARAEPVPALHLEALVPSGTLAFASLEEVGSWGRRMEQTAVGRMMADPEMKAFLAPLGEDLKRLVEGRLEESPIPPMVAEVFKQVQGLRGQVAVALVDLGGDRGPVVAGALDFGEHLGDFVTFLSRMKEQAGDDFPLVRTEQAGRPWWTTPQGMDGPPVVATILRTSILVSTDRAWLEQVVASDGAGRQDSLGALAPFSSARAKAGGDALALFVYANAARIVEHLAPQMPEEARPVVEALGIDKVRAVAYGMAFRGDGIQDTIVVEAPGADAGLLPLLRSRPATREGLRLAPSTAFAYGETTVGVSTIVAELRKIVGRIDPEAAQEFEKGLSKASEFAGVDIEKDFLGGLADDISWYAAMPETGGLYPEIAVSAAVKDPAAFEATAKKAVDSILARVGRSERIACSQRLLEWRGHRLYAIELSALRGDDVVPFTPTWTVLGNRWVLTLVPHAMKELILRTEAGGPGLAEQEDFRAVMASAPPGAGGIEYFDLQSVLSLLYDTAVPLLQTALKPNLTKDIPVRLDWTLLPPARTMRPYFRSLGAFWECDGQSLTMSVHSPVGYVLPVAAVSGAAAFLWARSMRHGGEEMSFGAADPESARIIAELQVQALVEAVRSHQVMTGKLPESLQALLQATNPESGQPYLERVGLDPWGNAYQYRVLDADKGEFEVRSFGPDRMPQTPDDIVLPRREE